MEQLVSFEVAKLLKEKGFNEAYNYAYINGKKKPQKLINKYNYTYYKNLLKQNPRHVELKEIYISPSQSLAQKWLREVHNIDITVALVGNGYGFYIHKNRNYTNNGENYGVSGYTYELALEAGLKEGLRLI